MSRWVRASLWVLLTVSLLGKTEPPPAVKPGGTISFTPEGAIQTALTAAKCNPPLTSCDVSTEVQTVKKGGFEAITEGDASVAGKKVLAVKSEGPNVLVERLPNGQLKIAPPNVSFDEVKSRLNALTSQKTTGVKSDATREAFLGGESLLSSGSASGSSSGGGALLQGLSSAFAGAGHTGSSATGTEAFQEKADTLKIANNTLRNSANSFSDRNALLGDDLKNISRANIIGFAREKIEFPPGSSSLGTNRFFSKASALPDGDLSTSFMKKLFQKDLNGSSISSKLNSLNDLAKDKFFQNQAGKIFGDKNLEGFNLAVLGANLISLPNSTVGDLLGANKALNGQLDTLIEAFNLNPKSGLTGTSISIASVEDWLEAAKILSSDAVTDKIEDKSSVANIKESYNDLIALMRKLGNYKSTDLLKLVSVPLKYSPKKSYQHLKEKIMSSVAKSIKVEDSDVTSIDGFEADAFKGTLVQLHKDLLNNFNDTEKFLSIVEKVFEDNTFTAKWALLDQPNFITTRRSLALLTLNVQLSPLEDLKKAQTPLTSLIASSFEYIEIRRKDARQREVMQAKEDEERLKASKFGKAEAY